MQLPPICSHEEVTIENTITAYDYSGRPSNTYTEILNHIGSGYCIVHHEIDNANLTLNQHYTLRMVVNVSDMKNVTKSFKDVHEFGKCHSAFYDNLKPLIHMYT